MMKLPNVLLACALGAGSLLGAAAPASAAHVAVGTTRTVTTGRVVQRSYYGAAYRPYGYRYGYGYPYSYGYPYGYGGVGVGFGVGYGGVGVGVGYGYPGGGYGYAPYPAAYAPGAYYVHRPWRRYYRRAYWGRVAP